MITLEDLSAMADAVQSEVAKVDRRHMADEVCTGADGTPTSLVDKVAEDAVLAIIRERGLKVNVLSEEIGFLDAGSDETLVLDPVDGSSNAIAGVPYYTVSLGVGSGSLSGMRLGYIRNLVTGDSYWAEKGKGAFKNGKPVYVRKPNFDDMFIVNYSGRYAHPDSYEVSKRVASTRYFGCASLELAIVAEGEVDAFYMNSERYSRRERIVDIAAGVLILREAGGEVYDLEGSVLDMPIDLEHRMNMVAVVNRGVFDYLVRDRHPTIRRKFGIYANPGLADAERYVRQVMSALGDNEYHVDREMAEAMGIEGMPLERMDVDIVIVIGGDGTLLRALQKTDAYVIGINGGSVGFLAEIDRDHIEEGIQRLLRGEYTIESRFKLRTWYNGEYLSDSVNEVVVHTASVAKIRHYKVYVDDVLACEMRSDGLIISTPTGSTCYAMSLGAPYIDPHVGALMVVPMAAYKFNSRPFVVPATCKITVESVMDKDCVIVTDGQEEYTMAGRTKVDFMLSSGKARFIRFNTDFFSRVREKLVNAL